MMRIRWVSVSMLLIFFSLMVMIGAIPGEATALSVRFGDKLLHTLAYALMTLISFYSVQASRTTRALFSLVCIAVLGLLDEGIQSFLPYRNASILDWCFDVGSALIVTSLLCMRTQRLS